MVCMKKVSSAFQNNREADKKILTTENVIEYTFGLGVSLVDG